MDGERNRRETGQVATIISRISLPQTVAICPHLRGAFNLDYCLGATSSLVSWVGLSFFPLAPQHICLIWDIISAQLKGVPEFLASIIFRIISSNGMPSQHPLNPFSEFFCSSDIFSSFFGGLIAPVRSVSLAHKTEMAEKRLPPYGSGEFFRGASAPHWFISLRFF